MVTMLTPGSALSLEEVKSRLVSCWQDVRDGHAQMTAYILETTKATERRLHTGVDLFSRVHTEKALGKSSATMRVIIKQHFGETRHQQKRQDKVEATHYLPVRIKTEKSRVPPYRFHYKDIKKSVLAPNTMLTFIPHVRDLQDSEEGKYKLWLDELRDIDLKSGFKSLDGESKRLLTIQAERAKVVSLYLDTWLESLSMVGCNRATLIKFFICGDQADEVAPWKERGVLKPHDDRASTVPNSNNNTAARKFVTAFRQVFEDGQRSSARKIDIRKVLMLDDAANQILDLELLADGVPQQEPSDELKLAENNLATYCSLGCLICFSHSCDHGEIDDRNLRRPLSMSTSSNLSTLLDRKRRTAVTDTGSLASCQRQCYLNWPRCWFGAVSRRDWTQDEQIVLRSICVTALHSTFKGDPICLAAEFLDRNCDEVHGEFRRLQISLPKPEPAEILETKRLPWYDRHNKILMGDWQKHTVSHEHQLRENLGPCSHNGACELDNCSCIGSRVLCDKFCCCTVVTCARKFTGCSCKSLGKSCELNRGEQRCICVQLNRECDPDLCGTCGVVERADPGNSNDVQLLKAGCQNCELQRGVSKSLLVGQSQLEGVGYGLYTAEDIAKNEFIIEYVGEVITHDEGVRREARRGNVFDADANVSYVFTLLEEDGLWVDAARYGNLSRYINHASEHDKHWCNVMPRVVYVNGEYRIKFTATRDIAIGEELFFNYGDNFPNLTKKLMNHEAKGKPCSHEVPRLMQRRRRGKPKVKKNSRQERTSHVAESYGTEGPESSRKRKRGK